MKKLLFLIIIIYLTVAPLMALGQDNDSLGVGASVPFNGQNAPKPEPEYNPPKPAENLYLYDFWAGLATEENSHRPVNHTQFDILFGWSVLLLSTLLIILLILAIIYFILRRLRLIKSKEEISRVNAQSKAKFS